jgi:hypothetical protein
LRLRLAAYGFALLIAAMNYSHYAGPGWRPTFVAVAVALCSAASPWLWGIHTRRTSRDRLMAAGLVEPHALRLGGTRWAWHPLKSVRVMRAATWEGLTDPGEAIGAVYPPAGVAGEGPPSTEQGRDNGQANSPATITETVRVTEGRPPSEWLDDQIMALLSRMSVRSTAEALGVSKTRVETAKRRAALAAAGERSRGGAVEPSHRAAAAPAVTDVPAGDVAAFVAAPAPAPAGTLNGQAAHG